MKYVITKKDIDVIEYELSALQVEANHKILGCTNELAEGLLDTVKTIDGVIKNIQSHPVNDVGNNILDQIEECVKSCSWLDDKFNGDGCPGKREGCKSCDGCSYFEIDMAMLNNTLDILRSGLNESI